MTPHRESCDVAVVGGGPAGSAAGTRLAQSGLRVTILEKEKFPRFAIGESLLPHGNDLLREIGVWEKLENAGFLRKYGAEFATADGTHSHRLWFGDNLAPRHEFTYQVERASFDQLLLDHARENGCTVHEGTRVTSLSDPDAPEMTLHTEGPHGPRELTARWVVDASGRCAFAGSRAGLRRRSTQKARRVAIYAHFEGAVRHEGKAEGHITIVRTAGGWFWFIPLAGNLMSVGLVLPAEQLRGGSGKEFAGLFDQALADAPAAAARLQRARRTTPLRTTADYSWKFGSFATRRILLTGDAAGFVDPIFSSGVMLALRSGLRAADLLIKAERQGRPLRTWERLAYTRSVTAWMNRYTRLIRAFYDRAGFEVFMSPQPVLHIPRSVARLVGGQTDPGPVDRLRLRLFDALCRLQRRLDIVPPIPSLR
ncbi:MAG: NAD(P)/FAD-dependent oxidoreductase [Chthoniobacterales bacterium]